MHNVKGFHFGVLSLTILPNLSGPNLLGADCNGNGVVDGIDLLPKDFGFSTFTNYNYQLHIDS